ncbi:hypothetical protein Hanom_Chr05g00402741 [Helianthus anomalus]
MKQYKMIIRATCFNKIVVVSGGLLQIRNQIVDAVIIARILLVLPVFKGDERYAVIIARILLVLPVFKGDERVHDCWKSLKKHLRYSFYFDLKVE